MMLCNGSSELPKPPIQLIKQDGKFYSKLLSKESSPARCPSFRVYYGVPFLWETQPGTPKHTSAARDLPPLTPPPSYYYSAKHKSSSKPPKLSHLLLLPKLSLRSRSPSSRSSFSSASSSSSSSVASSSCSYRPRRPPASPKSPFSSEEAHGWSPLTFTLCFQGRHKSAGRRSAK